MHPTKPEDFFVSEPLGDILFLFHYPVYYLDEIGLEPMGQGMAIPKKIVIRKIEKFNFLANMDGYFSQGKYHLSFEFDKIKLSADSYGHDWSFDKEDILKYVQNDTVLKYVELEDATDE